MNGKLTAIPDNLDRFISEFSVTRTRSVAAWGALESLMCVSGKEDLLPVCVVPVQLLELHKKRLLKALRIRLVCVVVLPRTSGFYYTQPLFSLSYSDRVLAW